MEELIRFYTENKIKVITDGQKIEKYICDVCAFETHRSAAIGDHMSSNKHLTKTGKINIYADLPDCIKVTDYKNTISFHCTVCNQNLMSHFYTKKHITCNKHTINLAKKTNNDIMEIDCTNDAIDIVDIMQTGQKIDSMETDRTNDTIDIMETDCTNDAIDIMETDRANDVIDVMETDQTNGAIDIMEVGSIIKSETDANWFDDSKKNIYHLLSEVSFDNIIRGMTHTSTNTNLNINDNFGRNQFESFDEIINKI